ncbi:ATP-binding protein [Shouchella shacheensis]|uniref:ATP-binding protein n=1 Tax=Shouchella shacheensis TaxID=1649580 RepID=UPI000740205F|nr:ATP-binding protein [Shouchella shacheensis]
MIIETLLLNVLITLAPVLVFSLRPGAGGKVQPPLVMFGFMSITVVLCMLFPFEQFDLYWDLRYVPILLAFLYGNKRAGWGVAGVAVVVRLFLGEEFWFYGVATIIITALVLSVFSDRYQTLTYKWPRLRFALLLSICPILSKFLVMVPVVFYDTERLTLSLWMHGTFYSIFVLISVCLTTLLYETLIERERILQEIVRAEKYNTLGELAASIAHEVRNPLTVVKGFLQLMSQKNETKSTQYYQLIMSELNRAEVIINDYLNFAKPRLDEMATVNVKENVQEVVSLLEPYALKDGVMLSGSYIENVTLTTDRNKLKQALINFVKNGIEATSSGGSVHVSMELMNERWIGIEIADTGIGMTKEQVHRVGSVYFTTKETGTGLGTMVSIRLIEAMGGTVAYKSEINKGTAVHIQLPASTSRDEADIN